MNKNNNDSKSLLNDAIRETSGAPATAGRATTERPTATPSNDLRSVLNELSGGAGAQRSHGSSPPSPHPSDRTGLNDLIREASTQGINPPPQHSPDNSLAGGRPTGRLGDVVQEAHAGNDPANTPTASARPWLRQVLRTLAVILMLVAAGFWWLTNPQPGPADTLQSLARAVEQFRSGQNGALPKELTALEGFPKNAVEWPLRYWKARDAAGRAEIIWVPQSNGHYRILLRQGGEVWTVTDTESKPKLAMKGNP